jgi:hypothetical protein
MVLRNALDLSKNLTRFEQILVELDAVQAADTEYKTAFSTGSKARLHRGETWRGRLIALVAYQQSKQIFEDKSLNE